MRVRWTVTLVAALVAAPVLTLATPASAVECWQVSPDVEIDCCQADTLNKVTRKLTGQDWFACLA